MNVLAPRAELLYTDHVRNMHLSSFGVPRILRFFQNRRICTVICRSAETHSSMAAYNIGDQSLCSRGTRYRSVCRIRVIRRKRLVRRMYRIGACAYRRPSMVDETGLVPKMSVAVRTVDSNPCRYTRRARHAAATCLVSCVCHVATTPLATRFTHILSCHGCCQGPYYVIISGNLIV